MLRYVFQRPIEEMTSEYRAYPPSHPVEMTHPYPASTAAQPQQQGAGYYPQSNMPVAPPAAPGYYYPPPGQFQQQPQPMVISQGPGPVIIATQQPPQSFLLHILLSCFVFWCCGCLFGLVAFILARK